MLQTKVVCRGFTLVEIMIVVGILGILTAIAIPNFLAARRDHEIGQVVAKTTTIEVSTGELVDLLNESAHRNNQALYDFYFAKGLIGSPQSATTTKNLPAENPAVAPNAIDLQKERYQATLAKNPRLSLSPLELMELTEKAPGKDPQELLYPLLLDRGLIEPLTAKP